LARRRWQASPQVLPHSRRRHALRKCHARPGGCPPYEDTSITAYCASIAAGGDGGHKRATAAAYLAQAAGDAPLHALTVAHVEAAEDKWSHLSQHTRYSYQRELRRLLHQLAELGAPQLAQCVTRTVRPEARTVRPTELEALKAIEAPDLPLRWICTCAYELGLRFDTSARATPRHFATGKLRIETKRGRVVCLPLPPRILTLQALAGSTEEEVDIAYIHLLNGRQVIGNPSDTLHDRWSKWKKRAGIAPGIRFHDLRRDFAHRIYAEAGDLRVAQAALGHSNVMSTLHYLHLGQPANPSEAILAIAAKGNIR
jgi:integrase